MCIRDSLADALSDGREPDRPPPEAAAQRVENRTVDLVEPEMVDPEQLEPLCGELLCHDTVGANLDIVADPPEQAVRDPRCPSRAFSDTPRPRCVRRHPEYAGRSRDDRLQLVGAVEVEPDVYKRQALQKGPSR